MPTSNSDNLALLIDGDNVSAKIIVGLMAEIASYGTASVRRIYGDFTSDNLRPWKDVLLRHSILPVQSYAYTTGKNATDGAMIIDAMDLLYTGRFSGFCIVSSDSDFTRLAARIREQGINGKYLYGFGERKTNHAFIAACDKFGYFDAFSVPAGEPVPQKPLLASSATPPSAGMSSPVLNPTATSNVVPLPITANKAPKRLLLDATVVSMLAQAIKSTPSYPLDDSWVNLADLGCQLPRISPDLNARNYGYGKLWGFLEASGIAELKRITTGNNAQIALVRLKKDAPT